MLHYRDYSLPLIHTVYLSMRVFTRQVTTRQLLGNPSSAFCSEIALIVLKETKTLSSQPAE
jgi:hypothetical protein